MDGELAEREGAALEEHLARCAECRERLAAYKQTSAGFEAYCEAMVDVAEEARVAEERREIPRRRANDLRSFATLTRDDNAHQKRGGLKPAATKSKHLLVIGAGAIAAAAAIAILLMLPRQRVARESAHARESARNAARTPATAQNAASVHNAAPAHNPARQSEAPASGDALHAVQRQAESIEAIEGAERAKVTEQAKRAAKIQVQARQSEAPAQGGTLHAAQRGLPAAAAQRTAPLAVSTGTAHRRAAARPAHPAYANSAAGRPARLERANGGASAQTAQNGQMRNASAALRSQGESKPQTENASAAEPPIEIAVPTESMFPPGAVPEGIGFTAVVTISADDSAQLAALRQRQ
jgi:hypothetical protein